MRAGGTGGSATRTGLVFEERVSLEKLFRGLPGYRVVDGEQAGLDVIYAGRPVARLFKGYRFYDYLAESGIDWRQVVSKRLLPDGALLVIVRDTLFIVEVKFQRVAGTVDEKLQTCDFKRKQYAKLTRPLGLKVEYVYVLSDWFKKSQYRDTLDYISSMNCRYLFNEIPLKWLGLPEPTDAESVNGRV